MGPRRSWGMQWIRKMIPGGSFVMVEFEQVLPVMKENKDTVQFSLEIKICPLCCYASRWLVITVDGINNSESQKGNCRYCNKSVRSGWSSKNEYNSIFILAAASATLPWRDGEQQRFDESVCLSFFFWAKRILMNYVLDETISQSPKKNYRKYICRKNIHTLIGR